MPNEHARSFSLIAWKIAKSLDDRWKQKSIPLTPLPCVQPQDNFEEALRNVHLRVLWALRPLGRPAICGYVMRWMHLAHASVPRYSGVGNVTWIRWSGSHKFRKAIRCEKIGWLSIEFVSKRKTPTLFIVCLRCSSFDELIKNNLSWNGVIRNNQSALMRAFQYK